MQPLQNVVASPVLSARHRSCQEHDHSGLCRVTQPWQNADLHEVECDALGQAPPIEMEVACPISHDAKKCGSSSDLHDQARLCCSFRHNALVTLYVTAQQACRTPLGDPLHDWATGLKSSSDEDELMGHTVNVLPAPSACLKVRTACALQHIPIRMATATSVKLPL